MTTEPRPADAQALKAGGMIRQVENEYFVVRLRVPGGNIHTDKMIKAAELANKYGRGYCHFTFQQSIEIPYVETSQLDDLKSELDKAGLRLSNCGPRVRAITACQGCRVNPYGVVDAPALATEADELYFGMSTPAKFKVSYSGCPIGCPNPQENDLGFHGMVDPELIPELCNGCSLCVRLCKSRAGEALTMNEDATLPEKDPSQCIYCGECIFCCPTLAMKPKRTGHAVYVGGKHGRFPRWGDRIADFVSDAETFELIEKVVAWYQKNGKRGERVGVTIDRLGMDKFKADVLDGRFKTALEWDRYGSRPAGVRYKTLHTWDTD
jgi:dissimilatory sulfite reductase (desulfoviridin) alpha/beta subunit